MKVDKNFNVKCLSQVFNCTEIQCKVKFRGLVSIHIFIRLKDLKLLSMG